MVNNKTIKCVHKLGKRGRKLHVLIKNNTTRKNIQQNCNKLKHEPLVNIKKYLKKKNLLCAGSLAPPNVLRQTYENAVLAGNINNNNDETLIDNFMK